MGHRGLQSDCFYVYSVLQCVATTLGIHVSHDGLTCGENTNHSKNRPGKHNLFGYSVVYHFLFSSESSKAFILFMIAFLR